MKQQNERAINLANINLSALSVFLVFLTFFHSPATHAAAPTISGSPPTLATVGVVYRFVPQASDPDGDRLSFRIRNRPEWASFDSRTGALSGTPRKPGQYSNIVIRVSDSRSRQSVSLPAFTITVEAAAAPAPEPSPEENHAPVISGTPPSEIIAGQAYSFTPQASDADGDVLSFTITNKPAWASFSSSTGRLSGTPSSAHIGSYGNIGIAVSDGAVSQSLAPFTIAVVGTSNGSATLSWEAPTTRTDGSPLNNLAGFRVLWGTAPGTYSNDVKLTNPGLASYVVDNLSPATYYFVVVAFDQNGLESEYSSVAQKVIQ